MEHCHSVWWLSSFLALSLTSPPLPWPGCLHSEARTRRADLISRWSTQRVLRFVFAEHRNVRSGTSTLSFRASKGKNPLN